MAVTVEDLNVASYGWAINATSADASGAEVLKAAPGAGLNLYVRQISINCATAITVTVGSGETGSAVDTPIVGPITFTAEGGQYLIDYYSPIKIDANTLLAVDASGSGAVQISMQGYTS